MITIEHLSKTFHLSSGDVHAVDDVSLHVEKGSIYGVIGYSGAGKSTLVRCINFLETPDSGSVTIQGFGKVVAENGKLFLESDGKKEPVTPKKLQQLRHGIGMIFQHFNLLDRNTVFDNIAYPLKYKGISRQDIRNRVDELLDLVDLKDKRDVYPSQLSGGQKQRVAIARALANNPEILLCDEATSALDPEATESILHLLKDLNEKLGLTIVIITHEMSVIKAIADQISVMEEGKAVEQGDVYDIFANPLKDITRRFINTSSGLSNIDKLFRSSAVNLETDEENVLLKFTFSRDNVGDALISRVSREYGVDVNILLANIDVVQDGALGGIIAMLHGSPENIKAAEEYLRSNGVKLEVINNA